jgi:hypothetical protein
VNWESVFFIRVAYAGLATAGKSIGRANWPLSANPARDKGKAMTAGNYVPFFSDYPSLAAQTAPASPRNAALWHHILG